jgi:Raf kinase inhibitor-like YbhB/YbcL family protein
VRAAVFPLTLMVAVLACFGGCRSLEHGTLRVSSPAFADGGRIPVLHTCDGGNISPALEWTAPPANTRSLAVIMDDPDARGWVHWVLFDLPADVRSLPEGIPPSAPHPAGGVYGKGNAGIGYVGPCPPEHGGPHRYSFRVYALDSRLDLPSGASKAEVKRAMRGHVLSSGELVGMYSRP